jgi:predicted hotdog family 3-hydroxylacyl-ACP dehydratase
METTVLLEKKAVENLLPQKFPFVMIDRMLSYSETALMAGLNIQNDNIFVENNTFLEAGLIEHMAQSVALHTSYHFFLKNETAPTGYIGSIKDIEIKKLPKVNDVILSNVTILQEFAGVTLVDIVTFLNNEEIASGQMKTVLAK